MGIDKSTVIRALELHCATGSVTKRSYPKERALRKLTTPCKLLIWHLVVQRPEIYLHEIQKELEQVLLLSVSNSTICRFLHGNGFTRKRLRNIALQQDVFQREQFMADVSVYSSDIFVFVDETGADRRNVLHKYGYSIRGKPASNHSLLIRGERVSAVACMSVNGILDVKTVRGTSDP